MKSFIKNKIINIINKTKNIINKLLDEDVKSLFKDLFNYKENIKYIFVYIFLLPVTILFLIINLFSFLIFFNFYWFYFFFTYFKLKLIKSKKTKIIKVKRRFKNLKNFYLIILEKILITFPKKKAFLLFYVILKKIKIKEDKFIEKDLVINWIKIVSNRYLVKIVIGLPYIVLNCNNILVKTIKNLNGLTFENKEAYYSTLLLNIYKNLIPDYTKLIDKLKIIVKKNKIKFNSKKEIIKALKHTKEFKKSFKNLKEELIYSLAKNKTSEDEFTKNHPTIILKTKDSKLIYSNETSSENLKTWVFMKDVKNEEKIKYEEKYIKNNFKHPGSMIKKTTFYTDPIETDSKSLIIKSSKNDSFLINELKEENLNSITANLTINLNKNLIQTKKIEINNKEKYVLTKNEIEKNFITWIKENQGKINNKAFDALMEINNFWLKNEMIIKDLTIDKKIELAQILGIDPNEFENFKEVNYKIFISFISKNLKN